MTKRFQSTVSEFNRKVDELVGYSLGVTLFFTFSPAGPAVPEPGSVVLACLGGLLLLGYG